MAFNKRTNGFYNQQGYTRQTEDGQQNNFGNPRPQPLNPFQSQHKSPTNTSPFDRENPQQGQKFKGRRSQSPPQFASQQRTPVPVPQFAQEDAQQNGNFGEHRSQSPLSIAAQYRSPVPSPAYSPPPSPAMDDATDTEQGDDFTIVGTCNDMCPTEEREQRAREGLLAVFERVTADDRNTTNADLCVKRTVRNYTSINRQPSNFRTFAALEKTVYFLRACMDREDAPLHKKHGFLWDRFREVRKEIETQRFPEQRSAADLAKIIAWNETAVRFHIVCDHELSGASTTETSFNAKLNTEQLNKQLLDLMSYYKMARARGCPTPNSPEIKSYYLLLLYAEDKHRSGKLDIVDVVSKLTVEELSSTWIKATLALCAVVTSSQYATYFKLINAAPYVMSCLLNRFYNKMRNAALYTFVKACDPSAGAEGNMGQFQQSLESPLVSMQDLQVLLDAGPKHVADYVKSIGGRPENQQGQELFRLPLFEDALSLKKRKLSPKPFITNKGLRDKLSNSCGEPQHLPPEILQLLGLSASTSTHHSLPRSGPSPILASSAFFTGAFAIPPASTPAPTPMAWGSRVPQGHSPQLNPANATPGAGFIFGGGAGARPPVSPGVSVHEAARQTAAPLSSGFGVGNVLEGTGLPSIASQNSSAPPLQHSAPVVFGASPASLEQQQAQRVQDGREADLVRALEAERSAGRAAMAQMALVQSQKANVEAAAAAAAARSAAQLAELQAALEAERFASGVREEQARRAEALRIAAIMAERRRTKCRQAVLRFALLRWRLHSQQLKEARRQLEAATGRCRVDLQFNRSLDTRPSTSGRAESSENLLKRRRLADFVSRVRCCLSAATPLPPLDIAGIVTLKVLQAAAQSPLPLDSPTQLPCTWKLVTLTGALEPSGVSPMHLNAASWLRSRLAVGRDVSTSSPPSGDTLCAVAAETPAPRGQPPTQVVTLIVDISADRLQSEVPSIEGGPLASLAGCAGVLLLLNCFAGEVAAARAATESEQGTSSVSCSDAVYRALRECPEVQGTCGRLQTVLERLTVPVPITVLCIAENPEVVAAATSLVEEQCTSWGQRTSMRTSLPPMCFPLLPNPVTAVPAALAHIAQQSPALPQLMTVPLDRWAASLPSQIASRLQLMPGSGPRTSYGSFHANGHNPSQTVEAAVAMFNSAVVAMADAVHASCHTPSASWGFPVPELRGSAPNGSIVPSAGSPWVPVSPLTEQGLLANLASLFIQSWPSSRQNTDLGGVVADLYAHVALWAASVTQASVASREALWASGTGPLTALILAEYFPSLGAQPFPQSQNFTILPSLEYNTSQGNGHLPTAKHTSPASSPHTAAKSLSHSSGHTHVLDNNDGSAHSNQYSAYVGVNSIDSTYQHKGTSILGNQQGLDKLTLTPHHRTVKSDDQEIQAQKARIRQMLAELQAQASSLPE